MASEARAPRSARVLLGLLALAAALACGVVVRKDKPARFQSVGDWRERKWTAERMVELLQQYPDRYLNMGTYNGRAPGNKDWAEMGIVVNEAQRLAKQKGVDASKILVHYRIDVYKAYTPEWKGCGEGCGWQGTMEDPFRDEWIMTVPIAVHREVLKRFWGGDPKKDPLGACTNCWGKGLDRALMTRPNTAERVVVLHGGVSTEAGRYNVRAVVMDMRKPDYRKWQLRRLLDQLREEGIDPGERGVILFGYKPGWHNYHDGPPNTRDGCYVPGSHMWTGPAHLCQKKITRPNPPGGPFQYTQYGPGEFRKALNDFLREMRAALDANGYKEVVIGTTERPEYQRAWELIDPELRKAPWLIGEWADEIPTP